MSRYFIYFPSVNAVRSLYIETIITFHVYPRNFYFYHAAKSEIAEHTYTVSVLRNKFRRFEFLLLVL